MIWRKFNSLKRGETVDEVAAQLVVAEGVVGLVGVNDEQSGSPETMRAFWSWLIGRKFNSLQRGKAVDKVAVQLVVAEDIVGLAGVDSERSGSPERAPYLKYIINVNKRDGLNS